MTDDRMCDCGHVAHWHSHAGTGSCVRKRDCHCSSFQLMVSATTERDVSPSAKDFKRLVGEIETLRSHFRQVRADLERLKRESPR